MPIIQESSYTKRPWLYFNAWMETLIPYFTRKKHESPYHRERLELADGDFLDLDWKKNGSKRLIIVSHGFEGNSKDHFILELTMHFKDADILVWHYRSCSKELNRFPRFYDHSDIQDLHDVIMHANQKENYEQTVLLGFSMGGNFVINYLGSNIRSEKVKCGLVFSTPMDLSAASIKVTKKFSRWIEKSFVVKLRKKIRKKAMEFSEQFDLEKLDSIDSLKDIFKEFILPLNGFSDIHEYYSKWSSKQFIANIKVPLLIVNAKNDPLLSEKCYPIEECESSKYVYLEIPKKGGHIGFTRKQEGKLWYIWRIEEFLTKESAL